MDDVSEELSTADKISRDAIEAAFRDVFATHAGKRVLYWMLEQCGMYEAAFTGEAASTNFILGKQEVGRRVVGKLDEINPQFYPQLLLTIAEIRDRERAAAEAIDNPENEDNDDAP